MSYSENKELIQARELMREGKLMESFQIISELGRRDNISPEEIISHKLLKVKYLYKSAKFTDAITYANDLLKESHNQGDRLTHLDTLLIQSFSHIMLGNVSKCEGLFKKAETLFKRIKHISFFSREKAAISVNYKYV
jgi:hypothetical protein